MKCLRLGFVILLLLSSLTSALSAGQWDFFFPTRWFGSVCEDSNYYWFGTGHYGLIRYEKLTGIMEQYHAGNSGLPSNDIYSSAMGHNGKLWLGTGAGVAAFHEGAWEVWTPEELCPGTYCETIDEIVSDDRGNIWVSMHNYVWDDGVNIEQTEVVVFTDSGNRQTYHFEGEVSLIGSYNGIVYASHKTGGILICFSNGKISTYKLIPDEDAEQSEFTYSLSSSGELAVLYKGEDSEFVRIFDISSGNAQSWISRTVECTQISMSASRGISPRNYMKSAGKLYAVTMVGLEQVDLSGSFTETEINNSAFYPLRDGIMIVLSGVDVTVIVNSKFEQFNVNPYPFIPIDLFTIDSENNLWVIAHIDSQPLLARYNGKKWETIHLLEPFEDTHRDGLPDGISQLVPTQSGELWLAHNDKLYLVSGSSIRLIRSILGIVEMACDHQDRLYVLCHDRLLRYAKDEWKQFTSQESGLPTANLLDMCIDHDGRIWILDPKKLFCYDGKNWSSLLHPGFDDYWLGIVDRFTVDTDNTIWLLPGGESQGVLYYRGGQWKQDNGYGIALTDIYSDPNGGWWGWTSEPDTRRFADGEGEAVYNSGTNIKEKITGCPWGYCYDIYIDRFNNKWFVMDQGLAVYNENGVDYHYPIQDETAEAAEPLQLPQGALMAFNAVTNEPTAPKPRYVAFPYRKGNTSGFVRKDLEAGTAVFNWEDFRSSGLEPEKLSRVELWDADGKAIGHMQLSWSRDSRIMGTFMVSGRHEPGEAGWKYYSPGEHMVSLLIQPEAVRSNRKPLVLVHGLGGSYPYFSDEFIGDLNSYPGYNDVFDIWQFYYPYDQQIERSAPMLGKALERVQAFRYTPNEGRVNILAHSMGGLVTRALIQNVNPSYTYQNNIEKFCMLGTPNHGSHAAYRISHAAAYTTSALFNEFIIQQDEHSPAIHQMFPGSSFMTYLNGSQPSRLYPGKDVSDSYLVVAGIYNILFPAGAEANKIDNDDGVVAVASASLMDVGIPLATVRFDHMGLVGKENLDGFPAFLAKFYADGYSHTQTGFDGYADNYWTTPSDAGTGNLCSIVTVKIIGAIHERPLHVSINKEKRIMKIRTSILSDIANDIIPASMNHDLIPCGINLQYNTTSTFMEHTPLDNPLNPTNLSYLACPLEPGAYRVEMYDSLGRMIWSRDACLVIQKGCTGNVLIDLSGGQQP